jgi:broad-specificity NMP kinase
MARIITVIGPPCSGKTTLVAGRIRDGEICIDLDRIAEALTFQKKIPGGVLPFLKNLGDMLPRYAAQNSITRIWQVTTRWHAVQGEHVIVLNTPHHVCMQRMAQRGSEGRASAPKIIQQWYSDFGAPTIDEKNVLARLQFLPEHLEIIDASVG